MSLKDWDKDLVEEMRKKLNQKYDEIIEHGFGEIRIVVSRESQKILIYATLTVALLLAIALPSFAELTRQDVEQIIRSELEPIKKEITAIKLDIAEMKGKIEALEGKMATKDDIINVQREVSSKFIAIIAALIGFWATLLAAIITIPYLYGRADREKVRQLEADVRELQKLKSEFETFKALTEAMESLREKARQVVQEKPELAEDLRTIGLL